jgi:L-fuculose-phosphate aldolase
MQSKEEIIKLKNELVEYGKQISSSDLVVGPGGNISARIGDVVYLSPSGMSFMDCCPDDYVGVDINTLETVDGNRKPTSEISMHLECYRVRPDIGAIIHTHPPYAIGVVNAGGVIGPMFPDFVIFVGDEVPIIDFYLPSTMELARAVGKKIEKRDVVLMKLHGLLTVGKHLKEAFVRTNLVEASAKIYFISKSIGAPIYYDMQQRYDIINLDSEKWRKEFLKG